MSRISRIALYTKLETTQATELVATCSRLEISTIRMQLARKGWRMRIESDRRTNPVTFTITRK